MTTHPTTPRELPGQVSVSIDRASAQAEPSGWHLDYSVSNAGETPVWLIVDDSLAYQCHGHVMELSHARARLQPGIHSYGYFNPQVSPLPPGGKLPRSLQINWPCRLSDLWNFSREATPQPGDYDVSVRIGYGLTAVPNLPLDGDSVEAPVLRWQQTAVSPSVRLSVYPYPGSNGRPTF